MLHTVANTISWHKKVIVTGSGLGKTSSSRKKISETHRQFYHLDMLRITIVPIWIKNILSIYSVLIKVRWRPDNFCTARAILIKVGSRYSNVAMCNAKKPLILPADRKLRVSILISYTKRDRRKKWDAKKYNIVALVRKYTLLILMRRFECLKRTFLRDLLLSTLSIKIFICNPRVLNCCLFDAESQVIPLYYISLSCIVLTNNFSFRSNFVQLQCRKL